MDFLNEPVVTNLIATVVVALIGLLSAFLTLLVKNLTVKVLEQTSKIKNEATQTLVAGAVHRVSDLTGTAVMSIQQELVTDIKDSIANGDGKYTQEDLLALKNKAVTNVLNQITPEVKQALNLQIADVEKYVTDLVSKSVFDLRNGVVATPILATGILQTSEAVTPVVTPEITVISTNV